MPNLPCDEVGLTVHDYAAFAPSDPEAVVVGHSLGGLTIPFVPARMTVFMGALVPSEGVFAGLDPTFTGTERDELGRSYWPTLELAAAKLYPDLSPEEAAAAFARLRPQAPIDPVYELPPGAYASIVTTRERAIRPGAQLEWARTVLGVEPLELDAGHSPFLTHPAELADLLCAL